MVAAVVSVLLFLYAEHALSTLGGDGFTALA